MKQQWPLTRPKKHGSWQREGMRLRIMRAATAEIARYGFGGAHALSVLPKQPAQTSA
jgi:hypothetical protein